MAFVAAGLGAVDQPTRPRPCRGWSRRSGCRRPSPSDQLNFQLASIVGPAIGGVLIATVGLAGAYTVDLLSFVASLAALAAIAPLPPLGVVDAAQPRGHPRGPALRP